MLKRLLFGGIVAVVALALASSGNVPTAAFGSLSLQATPTPAPGENITIGPVKPEATTIPPTIKTPPKAADSKIDGTLVPKPTFQPPTTLEALLKLYPDLKPYLDKVKDLAIGQIDLTELYQKVVKIFQDKGGSGVAAFLKDSGLLEKMGLPLAYLDLLRVYDKEGLEGVAKLAEKLGIISAEDELIGYLALDSKANLAAVTADLKKLGVSVYQYWDNTGEIEIGIPLETLAQYQTPGKLLDYLTKVATTKHVVGFRAPAPMVTSGPPMQGSPSKGAGTIGADKWIAAGITGKGVRVGVLDMGFGTIKNQLGKFLPANIKSNVPIDTLTRQPNNHGAACAMVVHGIAPDAEIYIAYYDGNSQRSLLSALQFLEDSKVQVVSYSVAALIGPRDGTSEDAVMVNDFVERTGVVWVNAAGNYAMSHTAFKYNEGADGLHKFSDDVNVMPFLASAPVTVIALNWDGNWNGGEKNEYSFVVTDDKGKEIAVAAEPRRGGKNQFPFQITGFDSIPGKVYYLSIARTNGTKDNILDIFIPNTRLADWAQVPEYSVSTPADAAAALSVGATGLTSDRLETYSSQGPTTDDRLKPDISAPTGEPVPGYERTGFTGTSGAAPLVAGAAALVKQAFPDLTGPEIKAYLIDNVKDLGAKGADPLFGNGRLILPDPKNIDVKNPDPGSKGPGSGGDVGKAGEPTATITDSDVKFNVKVKGQTGLQIIMSFELDNLDGKQIAAAVLFLTKDEQPVTPTDSKYKIGKTVGTGQIFNVKSKQTVFEDVTLFIPYSAFKGLKDGTELNYVLGILDLKDPNDPVVLAEGDPILIKVSTK